MNGNIVDGGISGSVEGLPGGEFGNWERKREAADGAKAERSAARELIKWVGGGA